MGPYRVIRFLMTLGLVSSLTACSLLLPDEEASSHPTLDSTSVPSEATVCGIVSASRLTEILNQGIHSYYYMNSASSSDYIAYDCEIRLDVGQYEQVRVRYGPERGDLDGLLMPPVEKTDSLPNSFFYEDVATSDSARPMVLDGVEGEGVTVQDTSGYAGAFAWRYPDGSVLSVGIMAKKLGSRDEPADVEHAIELAQEFVPTVLALVTAGDSSSSWDDSTGTQYINGTPVADLNTTPTATPTPVPTDTGTP